MSFVLPQRRRIECLTSVRRVESTRRGAAPMRAARHGLLSCRAVEKRHPLTGDQHVTPYDLPCILPPSPLLLLRRHGQRCRRSDWRDRAYQCCWCCCSLSFYADVVSLPFFVHRNSSPAAIAAPSLGSALPSVLQSFPWRRNTRRMGCGCSVRDPPHREGSFSSCVLPRTTALWYEPEMDSYAGDVPQKRCGSSLLHCSKNSEQKRVGIYFRAPVSSAENSTQRCRPVRSVLANPSYGADRRASAPHPLADSIEGWSEGSKNKMQTLSLPSGPSAESIQLHSDESIVTARSVPPGYDYAQYFRDAASPPLHGLSSPTQPNTLYSIPANALRMMEQGKHATFTLYDIAALRSFSADTTDAMPSGRLMPPRTDGRSSPRLPTPFAFAAAAVRSPTTPVAAASAFEMGSGTTLEDIAAKWASVPLRSTSETGTSAASSAGRLPNPDASYQLEKFVGMQRAPVGGPPRVLAADSSTSAVTAAAERSRYPVRPVGTTSTASSPRSGTSACDSQRRPAVVPIQYEAFCVTAFKPVAAGVTPAEPLPSEKISLPAGTHSPSVTADTTSLFASWSPSAENAEYVEVKKPQVALREVSTESAAEACDSQTEAMSAASPPVTKTSTQTPARSLPISAPSNTDRFTRRAARMERSKAVVANRMAQQEL